MKAAAHKVQRILHKYTSRESVTNSLQILRKLGLAESNLSYREAAELVYLACGNADATRARNALAMARTNTPAGSIVRSLEKQMRSGVMMDMDGMPTAMLREVAGEFRKTTRKSSSNASTPGYMDGRAIQVRGGATAEWKRHAAAYVIDKDTPKTTA